LLNILGYTCYSIYTCSLAWNKYVRNKFDKAFNTANLVTNQDCFFALHGALLTSITILQCCMYERGGQKIAWLSIAFVGSALSIIAVFSIIIMLNQGSEPFISKDISLFSWLCWIYLLSIVKLAVTVSKYIPQAVMNCRNKSTVGWSIGNVT
jgi:cystinosin